jgi:hypothetical protein
MPGFSLHLFNTDGTAYDGEKASGSLSIDGAFTAEYFFNEMFSLQTGLLYTTDTMTISTQKSGHDTVEDFSSKSLVIPVLAGVNFYPSIFSLGIYGGFYMDIPVGGLRYRDNYTRTDEITTRNVLFGYTAGGSAGIKLGPGIVFFDVRYMGDFMKTKTTVNDSPLEMYKRRIIALSIGYRIGLMSQKK